jgi:hypothetical protein
MRNIYKQFQVLNLFIFLTKDFNPTQKINRILININKNQNSLINIWHSKPLDINLEVIFRTCFSVIIEGATTTDDESEGFGEVHWYQLWFAHAYLSWNFSLNESDSTPW